MEGLGVASFAGTESVFEMEHPHSGVFSTTVTLTRRSDDLRLWSHAYMNHKKILEELKCVRNQGSSELLIQKIQAPREDFNA